MTSVAVVIPCFNHGRYLPEALDSVRRQTLAAAEIVVVDDGSTDEETICALKRLEEAADLRLIRQENSGPAAARNAGIALARAGLIACLDADDRLCPDFLEKTVPLLDDDPGAGIAYGRAGFFGGASGVSAHPPFRFPAFLLDPCIPATALFRRADWQSVGGYCEEMRDGWEDFEFWISLIEMGRTVRFVDGVLFEYRRHSGSRDLGFSSSRDRILKAFETIFRRHSELYSRNIRLLFEAHLERLDCRAIFPVGGGAELRLEQDGGERLVRSEGTVGSGGEVEARFRLELEGAGGAGLRLDPFDGPGAFRLRAAELLRPGLPPRDLWAAGDLLLDGYSFGVEAGEGEHRRLFFFGADPQVRFRWKHPPVLQEGGELVFRYEVERGPSVASEFLRRLRISETEFEGIREENRGLRLELEHVKRELAGEMERRRSIQASRAYRWTRWLPRLLGRRSGSPRP